MKDPQDKLISKALKGEYKNVSKAMKGNYSKALDKKKYGNGRSDERNRADDVRAIQRDIKEKYGNPYK